MVSEMVRATAARQTMNTRTVLAFYGSIVLIVLSGGAGFTTVLATTDTATFLIPWILGACLALVVGIIGGVFYMNMKVPQNLMLGQVSGAEYAEIQRITLGDTTRGERIVEISRVRQIPALPSDTESSDTAPIDAEALPEDPEEPAE